MGNLFNSMMTMKGWGWKIGLASMLVLQAVMVAQLRSASRRLQSLEQTVASVRRDNLMGRIESPRPQDGEGHPPASFAAHTPGGSTAPLSQNGTDLPWQFASPIERHAIMRQDMGRFFAQAMGEFERMERFINFDDGWPLLAPSPTMDMRQMADAYVVDFSLPGLDPSKINVSLEGRLLTVSGVTAARTRQSSVQGGQRFEQAVLLPGAVEADGEARAVMTNGVLRVIVPRERGTAGGRP